MKKICNLEGGHFFKKDFIFLEKQNWEEVTEIVHIPLSPHIHSLSHYQYPPPEEYI